MKKLTSIKILIASLVVLSGFQACTSTEESEGERQDPIVVEGVEASASERAQYVTYTGTLEPWKQINVGSASPGRIDRIFVQEGDRVEIGDPLVQMVDDQLRQARINYQTARREYERLLPLYEEGAVTRQQLDLAETEFENAEINLQVLEDNTQLQSKINGVVTEKWFEEGELYSAAPSEAGSPGIVQVMQIDQLKLMVNVNESMMRFIQEGEAVALRVDALPDMSFESEINRIFPTVDPKNRSFRVEILVDNTDNYLKPGMFARAEIETQKTEGIFIPREALMRGTSANSQDIVFLVNQDNIAVRQVVTTGVFLDEMVAITEGIEIGDFIVVKGRQRLEDGDIVEPMRYSN